MNIIEKLINKITSFESTPQKVGLSQFKETKTIVTEKEPSIKNKEVKLSDLMRRAG